MCLEVVYGKGFIEGIRGKMWRVLRSIYRKVESCVVVNGVQTDWFPVDTGVRQGCVLSPLLYALFINGLVKQLNNTKLGVEIGPGTLLGSLLYADDIVLISENKSNLQCMLNLVSSYSKKWKFELNPKKSEVVIFGLRDPRTTTKFRLGESELRIVSQYKYLGIELTRTLNWKNTRKEFLRRQKKNMIQTWAMGISGGFLSSKLCIIVYTSLVRSVLEYGCDMGRVSTSRF